MNVYDQFDSATVSANPYDQFDAPQQQLAQPAQNSTLNPADQSTLMDFSPAEIAAAIERLGNVPKTAGQMDIEIAQKGKLDAFNAGIPRIGQQEGTGAQIAAGLGNIPIDVANFALSPGGAATTLALPGLGPTAARMAATIFGAQGAAQAITAPTLQEKIGGGAQALLGGYGAIKTPFAESGRPLTAADAIRARTEAPSAAVEPSAPKTGEPAPPLEPVPEAPFGFSTAETYARFQPPETTHDITQFILRRRAFLMNEAQQLGQEVELSRAQGLRPHPAVEERLAQINDELNQPTIPTTEPTISESTVRLYHGGAGEKAGSDFTTSLDYAKGYAAKSGGKVWYVDVPQDLLKTHDEYGLPMTRVVVPNEIADQAKIIREEPTNASNITETEGMGLRGQGAAVGEETPLRQSGETPAVPQQQETGAVPGSEDIPPAAEPETTGIAQRVSERQAAEDKIGTIQPGQGASWQEMVARGDELIRNEGVDPDRVAADFARDGTINGDRMAVLRARDTDLAHEATIAEEALRQNPNDPSLQAAYKEAFDRWTDWRQNKVKPAQTVWHLAGEAMQGEEPIDVTSYTGIRRAVIEQKGRDLSPVESREAIRFSDQVRQASTEENGVLGQFDQVVRKGLGNKRAMTLDELRDRIAKETEVLCP